MVVVAWADARPLHTRRCCCLPAPWRRLCLQVDGTKVYCGHQLLRLTPTSSAAPLSPPEALAAAGLPLLSPPPPPAKPLLLLRIADGVQLAHGAGSPYSEWAFGAELGQGTFGVCRAVEHRRTRRRCACKVISRSFLEKHAPAKGALERELRIMRRLDALLAREATLQLVESAEFGDHTYLFLAPECSGDLLQLLDSCTFSEVQAAAVARVLLHTLHQLHAAGVCHLDVKPQNILWRHSARADGGVGGGFTVHGAAAEVFLGDFGSAREMESTVTADAAEGRVARGGWPPLRYDGGGSLHFTPPETFEEDVSSPASDVWATGCVIFMLLYSRHPFFIEGDRDEMVKLRILRATPLYQVPPDALPKVPPSVPDNVQLSAAGRAFMDALLHRDWEQRCSAREALGLAWLATDKVDSKATERVAVSEGQQAGQSQPLSEDPAGDEWTTVDAGELTQLR
ncbi:hypothetical protein AB1Y20_005078 [Prymnesium parvum]|uniref:Protein kinase domain-containing protein n=1 Tax=Prymnesium parvum TaxID=97485 RepID=A0AB34J684_PRYPA